VMDGLAATRAIRNLGTHAGLPIIAMTANAMKEDRDRCIEAGIDDYVTKPIDPELLFETVRRHYDPAGPAVSAEAGNPSPQAEKESPAGIEARTGPAAAAEPFIPVIEGLAPEASLKRVMGNRKLYIDLLSRFAEGQKDCVPRIRSALAAGDRSLAERLAHTLKGVSGNIDAAEVRAAAERLEHAIGGGLQESETGRMLDVLAPLVDATIDRIEAGLAGVRSPRENGESKEGSKAVPVAEIVERLTAYLEDSDSEALDYLESMQAELSAAYDHAIFEKLSASIRSFAFSAALEVLKGDIHGNQRL